MTQINQILLSKPQFELVRSEAPFPAFVGGFGSGKTEALIIRALMLKSKYPTGNVGFYLPTFDLVSMIALPRFEEKLEEMKAMHDDISFKIVKSPRPVIHIEDGGDIILRTMDNPARIVGYEVMDSCIDELDVLNEEQAMLAWRKILARNRQKKPDGARNTISVGTTPEGFKFVYQRWGRDTETAEALGYHLIRASTYSNQKNLPENYIEDLKADYPTNLIAAYIDGEFVNLTSGSVYPEFSRTENNSIETIKLIKNNKGEIVRGEDLHIGMDFNVGKMAATVSVQRDSWPHVVEEITGVLDTPSMIKAIKTRYPLHRIFVYPDSSGGSKDSNNASISDISLLEAASFYVYCNAANPRIKDRVLSVNTMIRNSKNQRRLFVNITACPQLVEGLEKQAYDKDGEPDKSAGLDHILDALGYFVAYNFPVQGHGLRRVTLAGV